MFSKLNLIIFIFVAALLVSACEAKKPSTAQPVLTPTSTPISLQEVPVRKAWFYKPPDDGNLALIAKEFNFFIMSKGDEPERDQLIALGATKPILQYVRFEAIMDPGSCTRKPWQNNAAYLPGDFCMISEQHPDWFLLDQDGRRIVDSYGDEDFVLMDPGNPGWRAFFLQRIRQVQESDKNWGGVFLDNVEVTSVERENDNKMPAAYPDEASYQAAVQGFLEYLHTNYFNTPNHLMFANLAARRDDSEFTKYLTYLDGVMHEGWAIDWPNGYRSAEDWEKQMTLAEDTQAMGKFIILVSQGKQGDQELQKFAFASYLLVNQGRAAFRYANSSNYHEAWLYDDYNLNLGKALGSRYRDGGAWRRDFTNGFVMVNPETHQVEIKVEN
jgi:hypothetical protein